MAQIYVKTFGCSANVAEGEAMQGLLANAKHEIKKEEKEADTIILNVCTVKGNENALKELKKTVKQNPNKKIIIAGCVPRDMLAEIREKYPAISVMSTHAVSEVVNIVERTLNNERVEIMTGHREAKASLPKIRKNPAIGILPISSGCVSNCAYCSVKLIKGGFISYPLKSIVYSAECAINEGCKELWLTSQDNGCYGFDTGTNLAKLIYAIAELPGDFKIRVGMASPQHVEKYLLEMINVMKNEKIYKFIHLPVQSGNNEVLQAMKRDYAIEEYKKIVENFKKEIPNIAIATDIIVGFPNETDAQFEDTLKMIEMTKPAVVNISRYAERKGTIGATMGDTVNMKIKSKRSAKITEIAWNIRRELLKKWKFWEGKVFVTEQGINDTSVARTPDYTPLIIKEKLPIGTGLFVKITETSRHHVVGKILRQV